MTTTITEREQLLVALESTIARGVSVTDKRNALMAELHASGMSLQQLADLLNTARAQHGTKPITRHGIFRMLERS